MRALLLCEPWFEGVLYGLSCLNSFQGVRGVGAQSKHISLLTCIALASEAQLGWGLRCASCDLCWGLSLPEWLQQLRLSLLQAVSCCLSSPRVAAPTFSGQRWQLQNHVMLMAFRSCSDVPALGSAKVAAVPVVRVQHHPLPMLLKAAILGCPLPATRSGRFIRAGCSHHHVARVCVSCCHWGEQKGAKSASPLLSTLLPSAPEHNRRETRAGSGCRRGAVPVPGR